MKRYRTEPSPDIMLQKIYQTDDIYYEDKSLFFINPRRVINAYGNERLYKIQAVTVIPPLRAATSQEKRHQSKQSNSGHTSRRPFTQVFEDACETQQQKDIHICSTGYTKDALPLYTLINMREYR
ncbi:MAG: hypothetical protein J6B43_07165 [Lachnospiraceae bacterium]|nr:hypothetical protein [Lachnospiraceae bacterium]